MYDNLRRVHEAYPDKNIMFTEGCAESFNAARYNAWVLGEEYGRSMINDFNNGMVGFTDWNILLDETGGPNHVQNFCFAPVLISDTFPNSFNRAPNALSAVPAAASYCPPPSLIRTERLW